MQWIFKKIRHVRPGNHVNFKQVHSVRESGRQTGLEQPDWVIWVNSLAPGLPGKGRDIRITAPGAGLWGKTRGRAQFFFFSCFWCFVTKCGETELTSQPEVRRFLLLDPNAQDIKARYTKKKGGQNHRQIYRLSWTRYGSPRQNYVPNNQSLITVGCPAHTLLCSSFNLSYWLHLQVSLSIFIRVSSPGWWR